MRTSLLLSLLLVVSSTASSQPVLWSTEDGGNGHYYEYVITVSDWNEALAAASARTWLGVSGHLATITSGDEDAWVWDNLNAPFQAWLGAYQVDPGAPATVGWTWVTGEPWSYENWWTGEPNDGGDTDQEDVLAYSHDGTWNDADRVVVLGAMVVEYESPPVSTEDATWGGVKAAFR